MANLKHVVSDLHQVYLTEMEAQIKPQLDKSSGSSGESDKSGEKKSDGGGGDDNVKKAARQLAYDTRYKARRDGIPLERAFSQSVSNSNASAPVKDAAKAMLFKGDTKEEVEVDGSVELDEKKKGEKEMVLVTPKKGYGREYRRFADRKKQAELRTNPQIQSVTGTSHGDPYEGDPEKSKKKKAKSGKLDPVGKEDGDVDNDGDKDSSDKYLMKRRKAIGKAIAKTKKEEFSNWKVDLGLEEETMVEVAGEEKQKKISGKGVKNKIVINPELKEGIAKLGGEVLEVEEVEVDEVYKGKHGQSDKEYMDSRSDAGKQISGDSKHSGAAYSHRSFKGQGKPAKPGERQKMQGKMTKADRDELAIRKAALKKEETVHEEKPYERIDRLNKERIAKQKAAKDAETAKRDKRVADFKKFREGERAKGTRHDHILDKWQQKKIAAKKQAAEAVDSASALSAKQQDTERMQAQTARNEVDVNRQAALKQKKRDAADREALKREIRGEEVGIDERTRYAKETGKDFKTGNPSEKGGTRSGDSAFDKVSREMRKTGGMMSSRKNAIPPQGKKKEKGAKGYKGVTPVDRIRNRLAQKRAPKPNPYRARAGESD